MSGRPAPRDAAAWTDKGDETPDPVDDGIAVGVPPAPSPEGPHSAAPEDEPIGSRDAAAQRDEYLDALQRLQADFENYKKRVSRQQEEQSARAAADLVTKLLPVLDTLDLALAHADGSEGALEQARAQFLDLLIKEGLERVDEVGVAFDPAVHDAVARAESSEEEPDGVAEVMRAGYRWRGQVLRPAMVRVRS